MKPPLIAATTLGEILFDLSIIDTPKSDGTVAYLQLTFTDEVGNPFIKGRGFRIKTVKFSATDKPVFILDAPAYKGGVRYWKSFIVENKTLWNDIQAVAIDKLLEMNGGISANVYYYQLNGEGVDPDEVPF